VHISTIGLAGHPVGESLNLAYLDAERAARAVRAFQGFCLGVKVRQAAGIVGENGIEPLRRAVQAAELAGPPARVMVHSFQRPAALPDQLALLRPGDIITHCFNAESGLCGPNRRVIPAARAAREQGIRFDVGHGRGSFSWEVARLAVQDGFWPDTISTDLHARSVNFPAIDLPTTLSKFLHLGLPLEEVIARATVAPAQLINSALPPEQQEPLLGTLQVGAPGDIAVLELRRGRFPLTDTRGVTEIGEQVLAATYTVRGGRLWGRPYLPSSLGR